MKIIDQNGKLYLQFYSSSKLITRSLALTSTKQNIAYATKKLMPIFTKLYLNSKNQSQPKPKFKNPKSPILKELCTAYLNSQNYSKPSTAKTATYALKRAFDFLPDKPIALYTTSDITAATSLMRKVLSTTTINLILGYLLAVFSHAKQRGFIKQTPPFKKLIPRPIPQQKPLPTKTQVQTILKTAKDELQIFLYIGIYTGARSGEILALCTEDIDYINQKLTISKNQTRFGLTSPKNGTSRQIPLPKILLEFLKAKAPKSGKIFVSDYFRIYYKFNALLKALNYPKFGLHITRHIYANTLMSGFISPQFIANSLGHSSLNLVNKTYSHFLFQKSEFKKMQKILNF